MKNYFYILFCFVFLPQLLFGYKTTAINAYAVSIYDKDLKEENVQGLGKTKVDYNGVAYTKIYAFGRFYQESPSVKIGNSKGHLVDKKPIYKEKMLVGYEMLFKHYTVEKGYIKVLVGKRLFDSKVYVR